MPEYKLGSLQYHVLCSKILKHPNYINLIKKGYPLFGKAELIDIVKKYHNGITFKEIQMEQKQKSPVIIIKKPTFNKYLQDGFLSKTIGYKQEDGKRVAIYKPQIVTQLNIMYYLKITKAACNKHAII